MVKNRDFSHRKATCVLRVTNEKGEALANKKLLVKQTNHEFLFGGGAFFSVPHANKGMIPDENIVNLIADRMDKWLDIFNYATLPFYLGGFEPKEGEPHTKELLNAAKFLQDNNVKVKGHPLCWHTACADWLMQYDNETILKKQLERINRDMTDFKGVVDMWDVINEVVIMPIFDKYDNAITRVCKDLGRVGIIKETFKAARAANPNATLLLNDFNTSSAYEILIDGCLNAGVPIDVIGIQSHQHQGYWGAEKLEEVLERFTHFGVPVHFTENTIISGQIMPADIEDLNDYKVDTWPSTPEGEERQKNELEEMYTILFANPSVKAITNWDFEDGQWLGAPSGIIRKDNSLKPAYERLRELIKKEWWTEYEVCTDDNGFVSVNGFKGDYEISDMEKTAAIKLTDSIEKQDVVLK